MFVIKLILLLNDDCYPLTTVLELLYYLNISQDFHQTLKNNISNQSYQTHQNPGIYLF